MLWSGGKHGLVEIVICCGLICKFFFLFAWKADDIWHLIIFNTCSCKAGMFPPGELCTPVIFSISKLRYPKWLLKSMSGHLQNDWNLFIHCLVTKQAWKYEKLLKKILISAIFLNQVLSSMTNLRPHKSAGQFTSRYRIQNLRTLFR